jgi:hypothetical protein
LLTWRAFYIVQHVGYENFEFEILPLWLISAEEKLPDARFSSEARAEHAAQGSGAEAARTGKVFAGDAQDQHHQEENSHLFWTEPIAGAWWVSSFVPLCSRGTFLMVNNQVLLC